MNTLGLQSFDSITRIFLDGIGYTDKPSGLTIHPWTLPGEDSEAPREPLRVEAGSPRLVESDWFIPEGMTVEFAPGAEVRLAPGVSIISKGRLVASGTAERPVRFRPMQTPGGEGAEPSEPWGVVALQGSGAGESLFQHTLFEGGNQAVWESILYSAAVNVHYAPDVRFENCTFRGTPSAGRSANLLRFAKAEDITVADCDFENARQNALVLDFTNGRVSDCRFSGAGNDAIDLMESSPVIANVAIRGGAFNKGISAGENSAPLIFNTLVRDARVGVEVKDASRPLIAHCDIQGQRIGIDQYAKNWRYGEGGRARVWNSLVRSGGRALQSDERSLLQAYHSLLSEPPREAEPSPARDGVEPSPGKQKLASLEILFPHTNFEQCLLVHPTAGSSADADANNNDAHPPAGTIPGLWTASPEREEIGLIPTEDLARHGIVAQLPRTVFSDRFFENFTTSLGPWTAGGEFERLAKNHRHLEAAAKENESGAQAWIERTIPPSPATTAGGGASSRFLAIEARSAHSPSAPIVVKFHTASNGIVENRVTFRAAAVGRRIIELPPGGAEKVSIDFPPDGDRIDIHLVELLAPGIPLSSS